MRMSRKAGIHKSGFVVPPLPSSWAWHSTYTANATFTAPQDGWYRLHVIGRGGNGGEGGAGSYVPGALGGGGGGGGAGYYETINLFLFHGDIVGIVYTATKTSISYANAVQNGDLHSNAGTTGGSGEDENSVNGTGGAGDPSGENGYYNAEGGLNYGGNGAGGNGLYRGTGGVGGRPTQQSPNFKGSPGTGVTAGSGAKLGAAGGGGAGGVGDYPGGAGGAGYTGGVVIEKGA